MRHFYIIYKPIKKNTENIIEQRFDVKLSKPKNDIGYDAQAALRIFISSVGSLKKYDIVKIQEVNENGTDKGEPIVPTTNSIVPTKRER